jgi:polar amino acid transport system substrate-binding protein
MPLKILATFALALVASNALAADISPDALRELAPSGKLRVAINYGNPVLASKDRIGGHLHGLAVDIARELGRQSGLPVELVGYEKAADVVANVNQNAWDVAFVSAPVARTAEIAITAPYMEIEVTYLVPARSRFRSVSDVDSPGVRIVVQENYSTDFFLSNRLMHAVIFRTVDDAAALKMLKTGAAEAFASSKHRLLLLAQSDSDYRVLDDRFATIAHTLGVPAGRNAAAAYVSQFAEDIKTSGFLQRAIENSGVQGVVIAPAAR